MDTEKINEKIQRLQFQHDRLTAYVAQIGKLMGLLQDAMAALQIERSRVHAEQVEKFSSASAK